MTGSQPASSQPIVACRDVTVRWEQGNALVQALAGVSLAVAPNERIALVGRSGSGKTTLLHVLGGLLMPSSGSVEWHGLQLRPARSTGVARANGIACVFQGGNLLPHFTAFENVAFAAQRGGGPSANIAAVATRYLELVGLAAKLDHLPEELSGGEAQRVGIARALCRQPELLLCDEPTGRLDSDTAARVLDLIDALHRELGFALIVATHDRDIAARFTREVELEDGIVIREEVSA